PHSESLVFHRFLFRYSVNRKNRLLPARCIRGVVRLIVPAIPVVLPSRDWDDKFPHPTNRTYIQILIPYWSLPGSFGDCQLQFPGANRIRAVTLPDWKSHWLPAYSIQSGIVKDCW